MPDPSGRRILIIEDEALIALDVERVLTARGWVIVGIATNQASALAAIEVTPLNFDVATLDINLGGEMSIEVADALESHGIPFVVVTGYDDIAHLMGFEGRPIVQKPIADDELAEALEALGR